jgi:cysteine desulfurase
MYNEFFKKVNNLFKIKTINGYFSYVNLDNAATTPPFKKVERTVSDYMISYGSVHRGAGAKSKISTDIYEETRNVIRNFVNAPDDSYVLFTGNTTGAMNTAAYFFAQLKGKVAVSAIEHSSSWLPWVKTEGERLLSSQQYELSQIEDVNKQVQIEGRKQVVRYDVDKNFEFNLKDIEKVFQENNIKVFILTASSNVTGYCPDIKAIGEIVHKYNAYFLVDGCQFIQHHKIDMQEMGIDFLAASGHKFYAPYGGGFLIGPKDFLDNFLPYQIGGGNLPYITESGEFLRYKNQLAHDPGTPNAVGAVAMAEALKVLNNIGIEKVEAYETDITRKAFNLLKANPNIELYVSEKHLSTVIPFNVKGVNVDDVAERLNSEFGIGVRAGSFCAYSIVRNLLNISDETEIIQSVKNGDVSKIPGFVRASFSLQNNEEDVKRFVNAIGIISNYQ